MVAEFLRALEESEKTPERMTDAVRCLDLSGLDRTEPAEVEKQGPLLAKELERVIDAILNTYGKSRDEIPKAPESDSVRFPREAIEGELQLELVRSAEGLWRFSAATIGDIPEYLEQIEEQHQAAAEQAPPKAAATAVPAAYRSARATMRTFLNAMSQGNKTEAATCLDLSDKATAATVEQTGETLVDQLLFVMDRIEEVVLQDLSDSPDGEPFAWHLDAHGRIELARQEGGDRKGYWLFSKATVNSIEPLYKAFQDKTRVETLKRPSFTNNPRLWLLEQIPPGWKSDFLGVQSWQWPAIALLILLGYLIHRVAHFLLGGLARTLGRSRHIHLLPVHITAATRPLGILVMVATWWGGLQMLLVPIAILQYVWPALNFVMTVAGVWAAYRLIDLVSGHFAVRAERTVGRLDDVLVPLLRKTAKIVVAAIGIIFILKAIGISKGNIDKLFAGLGLGGLAFALAAKDSLANFFGSVTVILDRPFQVGDWVKIGDVEGTVESVGLRSSRIRTFYNSEVTVPNSDLTNANVDNMGRRRFRRISCKLAVTYSTTPEQLDAFCEGIRELIRRHPYTRKDYYVVWVNEFADSSINILLYCFHETPDWTTELRERHRLFLDIIRLANRLGVEFAFPTQTIHLASGADSGLRAASMASADPTPRPRPDDPASAEQALALGRDQASRIVRDALGDPVVIPPPFEFPSVD